MAEYWLLYDTAAGAIRQKGSGPDGSFARQIIPPEMVGVIVSETAWDFAAPPLAEMKAAVWEWVKARRNAVIVAGAPTPIGVVQADSESRVNLLGGVVMASLAKSAGVPFATEWTDLANVDHQLDADGMIAVGIAAGTYVTAAHDNSRTLRDAIETASDLAALLAIDVTAGWPGVGGG